MDLLDLQMAKNTIVKEEGYKNFCIEHGFVTKKGNLRYTAEIIYRFITGNTEFIEEHTGLADALIEKEIFYWVCRKKAAILKYFTGTNFRISLSLSIIIRKAGD